jgi:hypothetical protein
VRDLLDTREALIEALADCEDAMRHMAGTIDFLWPQSTPRKPPAAEFAARLLAQLRGDA